MTTQSNSIWYIGDNSVDQCGEKGAAKSLKLCQWSKQVSNVIKISRGYGYNIFTISSYKDEFAVSGYI